MHRFRRLIALVLLALWLPATLHCDLEAAGIEVVFVCHDAATHASAEPHCLDDACHGIEDAPVKPFVSANLVGVVVLPVVEVLAVPLDVPEIGIRPERSDVPREIGRTWQFSARAAPPPRAPSLT